MEVTFHADPASPVLDRYRTILCSWLTANRINPNLASEVTVRGEKITVVEFVVDPAGRYVTKDSSTRVDTRSRTVPLREPVPEMAQKAYNNWKDRNREEVDLFSDQMS